MTSEPQPLTVIRDLLSQSNQPVFYVSRTATHLIGVEKYVLELRFISLVDSWNGTHPSVFVPGNIPSPPPRGNVNVVNWLLQNDQVREYIAAHTPGGMKPQIMLAFFDETSERICERAGYDLIMPKTALRERLDSKMVTTRMGEEVGVASAPNIIATITDWTHLHETAMKAGLGTDLVLQTAYGNSGETTYFVSHEADFAGVAKYVVGPEVKIMKRINHLPVAVDAVVTQGGTVVGPLLSEVSGHRELTQYAGGWSGNEMSPTIMSQTARAQGVEMVRRFGDRLAAEGYRGTFGIDLLIDIDTDEVYLGEMNPRLTGTMSLSNLCTGPFEALPFIALHVFEYQNDGVTLDVEPINQGSARPNSDEWSHLIIRATDPTPVRLLRVPQTGVYRESEGVLEWVRDSRDWRDIAPGEVFYLNTVASGSYSTRGSDMGIVYVRERVQDDGRQLTDGAQRLIRGAHDLYDTVRLTGLQNLVRKARLLLAMALGR